MGMGGERDDPVVEAAQHPEQALGEAGRLPNWRRRPALSNGGSFRKPPLDRRALDNYFVFVVVI